MAEDTQTITKETIDLSLLEPVFETYAGTKGTLIAVLQQAQEIYGYLPPEVLVRIAERMQVPLSQVYGVATFYAQFYLTRRGEHVIRLCDGTACHVKGARRVLAALEDRLGIKAGETTPDYKFTLEVVYCLGSCGLAPVGVVDGQVIGHLVPEKILDVVDKLS
ncbi:MAG: NADH-quinone oxidoreductase subunit NuoE [Anaerolineae bacterium]|nr:NADH-quinone oxidoreductase subunit NuoE [Anaerolineae bacterium]